MQLPTMCSRILSVTDWQKESALSLRILGPISSNIVIIFLFLMCVLTLNIKTQIKNKKILF